MKVPDKVVPVARMILPGLCLVFGGCMDPARQPPSPAAGVFWSAGHAANLSRVRSLRVGHTTETEMFALFGPANDVAQKGEGWTSLLWWQGYDPARRRGSNYEMLDIEVINGVVWFYCYHDGRNRIQDGTPPPTAPLKREVQAGSHVPVLPVSG